jgi:hypothetical protein
LVRCGHVKLSSTGLACHRGGLSASMYYIICLAASGSEISNLRPPPSLIHGQGSSCIVYLTGRPPTEPNGAQTVFRGGRSTRNICPTGRLETGLRTRDPSTMIDTDDNSCACDNWSFGSTDDSGSPNLHDRRVPRRITFAERVMPQRQSVVVVALIGLGAVGAWAWQQSALEGQEPPATGAAEARGALASQPRLATASRASAPPAAPSSRPVTAPSPAPAVPPQAAAPSAAAAENDAASTGNPPPAPEVPGPEARKFAEGFRDNR